MCICWCLCVCAQDSCADSKHTAYDCWCIVISNSVHVHVCVCRTRVQTVDMRQSHKWYPVARALQRKIIYHAGPTNSGKTYQALKVHFWH